VPELDHRDWRLRSAVPVTAPARTILDFAGDATHGELERAVDEARVQRLVTEAQIASAIERAPTRKGAGALRTLMDGHLRRGFTQSDAERKMRALVRKAGLPAPEANARLLGFRVDFLWPAERLVVEVDSRGAHGSGAAFERDRRRDQVLVAAGYRVVRVTWRQLRDEPFAVIARIAQALR
jgi:very-short-patch-repair endonuclease